MLLVLPEHKVQQAKLELLELLELLEHKVYRVHLETNSDGFSFHSSLAAADNSVFIVWEDHIPGAPDILFKSSQTAGVTFDRTINLSNNEGQSFSPTISAIL
ncbi:MAG: hypothetical protein ACRD5B_11270 [Nitrososphaeraceae archaeon]